MGRDQYFLEESEDHDYKRPEQELGKIGQIHHTTMM